MLTVFFTTFVVLEPPVLDPERFEQRFNRELVVGFSSHRFTDQRRMVQCMGGIAASGARLECQFLRPEIPTMTKDIIPAPVVGCASGFRTYPRGMVEQLFYGHLRLAGIAQWLCPGNE